MEKLIEKFKDYKLVHINTINDECYELIFSNEDSLFYPNLSINRYKRFNNSTLVSNIILPKVNSQGESIDYLIIRAFIAKSAGLEPLVRTNNNITINDLYQRYDSSLLGAFTLYNEEYYELYQSQDISDVIQTLNQLIVKII